MKQVKVNHHLLHVIKKIPTYAKVIKRKHHVKKTASLAKQVSAVINRKTPPNYKDTGYPTITFSIGNHECTDALLDIGASVNLMPLSIYLKLGL